MISSLGLKTEAKMMKNDSCEHIRDSLKIDCNRCTENDQDFS